MNKNERVIHLGKNKNPDHPHPCLRQQSAGKQLLMPPHQPAYHHGVLIHRHPHLEHFGMPLQQKCYHASVLPAHSIQNHKISLPNQTHDTEKWNRMIGTISTLERRLKQMEEQKQQNLINSHQEIQRLISQNSVLRSKLLQLEGCPTHPDEINKIGLVHQLPAQHRDAEKNQLEGHEEGDVSIDLHLTHCQQEVILRHGKNACCAQQSAQNRKLRTQLVQLAKASAEKERLLQSSLHEAEKREDKIRALEYRIEEWQRLNEVLNEENARLKQQTQEYVDLLLKKSQSLMRMEDSYKEKFAFKEQDQNAQPLKERISLGGGEVEGCKDKGGSAQENRGEGCLKCKDFIKALVKLNQKAYTGGIMSW